MKRLTSFYVNNEDRIQGKTTCKEGRDPMNQVKAWQEANPTFEIIDFKFAPYSVNNYVYVWILYDDNVEQAE